MKKRGCFAMIFAGGLVGVLFLSPAIAQCPEGKTEILMTLKTGKTIMICISEQGAKGLENAGDKSPAIVLATCPCFTEEAVASLSETVGVGCEVSEDMVDCVVGGTCPTPAVCVEERPCTRGLQATTLPSCVDVYGDTSDGMPVAYFAPGVVSWEDFCDDAGVTCVDEMTVAEAEACMNILKQYPAVCRE